MTTPTPSWILQVSSGVGPVEVRRFVGKLARLVATELVRCGMTVEAALIYGAEAEPRAVQYRVTGDPTAVGEMLGTYVLVARNFERGRKARKRWFAGVALFDAEALGGGCGHGFDERDVRVSTCRAGGPGGQHVNRRESAVRAVHTPTGIAVRVSAERSQHQNRRVALSLLSQALHERSRMARSDAQRERRHHHHQVARGNAVRAFRLDRRGHLVEAPRPQPRPKRGGPRP